MPVDTYIDRLTLSNTNFCRTPRSMLRDSVMATRSADSGSGSTISPPAAISGNLQAAVNAGSLLSFVDGVSAQEQDDILFSVQFAQRGASGAFHFQNADAQRGTAQARCGGG